MKNIFLAFLILAGTTVMAQSGAMKSESPAIAATSQTVTKTMDKADIQKSLDITESQADRVFALQQKYCGPDAKMSSSDKQAEAYFAALKEVIPADKAEKLMAECKMSCSPTNAEVSTAKKGCCAGSSSKKSCSDKKK